MLQIFRSAKLSRIERGANFAVFVIFISQIVLVSFAVICIYIIGYDDFSRYTYIYPNPTEPESKIPLWLERWYFFLKKYLFSSSYFLIFL